jgi:hypothetical protein
MKAGDKVRLKRDISLEIKYTTTCFAGMITLQAGREGIIEASWTRDEGGLALMSTYQVAFYPNDLKITLELKEIDIEQVVEQKFCTATFQDDSCNREMSTCNKPAVVSHKDKNFCEDHAKRFDEHARERIAKIRQELEILEEWQSLRANS